MSRDWIDAAEREMLRMYGPDADRHTLEPGGPWMQTWSGRAIYFPDPDPKQITLADIAHHLALQCRYNGAVLDFYSVAQHSVLVSRYWEGRGWSSSVWNDLASWGLMHDAAEAYVGDMVRPLKHEVRGFAEVEDRVARAVAKRFGLDWPMPKDVHKADRAVMQAERLSLLRQPFPGPWPDFGVAPWPQRVIAVGPAEAERMFLQRAHELGIR